VDNPAGINTFADQTTALQMSLLKCQVYALNFQSTYAYNDQLRRHWVDWDLPYCQAPNITSPIIIPPRVNARSHGGLLRNGQSGTITSNYNGNTAALALANLYMPGVIVAFDGFLEELCLYCNPDGVHEGSGLFVGKSWYPSGVTLVSSGAGGYHVNDVLTLAQPEKYPYGATQVTVNSVDGSGNILTYTMSGTGSYSLPDKLQQIQWTAANGLTGSIAAGSPGLVLDPTHLLSGVAAFVTSGGNGSGALFTQTWVPDWNGTTSYTPGNIGGATATKLGDISVSGVGYSLSPANGDPTYGYTFGAWFVGLNNEFRSIATVGGDVGVRFEGATDVRGNWINPVLAGRSVTFSNGGSTVINGAELDTCSVCFFDIDNYAALKFRNVQCISGISNQALSSGYGGRIGHNSSRPSNGIDLDVSFRNCGQAAGATALYINHLKGGEINIKVTSYLCNGTAGTNFFNKIFEFGSSIDPSCKITGMIDWGGLYPPTSGGSSPSAVPSSTYNTNGTPIAIFAGTMPNCRVEIWNADVVGIGVPGMLDNSGNYTIWGTTPPTTGNWFAGTKMINTSPIAGNPRGWFCTVAGASNNGGTWTAL
jgi:hypothetical protein